jgi:CCR4-NOT transcriptional regulation complex NOT5 subunit
MVEEFDPSTIEDEKVRQVLLDLMNLVEALSAKLQEKDELIERLRDEIKRLKGEHGKPKISANAKANPNLSSEKERRQSRPHDKGSKQDKIEINREVVLTIDQEQLPEDAVFKGYVRRLGVYEIPA